MYTAVNHKMYGTKAGMAFEFDWNDDQGNIAGSVRVIKGKDGMITKQSKLGEDWVNSGKPYIVKHDNKREGERIIDMVLQAVRANR